MFKFKFRQSNFGGIFMIRYKCVVSYDGYDYFGYQKQNHHSLTIQETIQSAFKKMFNEEYIIYASGRTDAKVHAYGQVFHVDLKIKINNDALKKGLNSFLPHDIRIIKVNKVASNFHARYDVKQKVYEYHLLNKKELSPFESRYNGLVKEKIDLDILKEATKILIGTHNFKNFTTNKETEVESFVKTIYDIKVKKSGNMIKLEFYGSGFLRYMVRLLVGGLIVVATGKKNISYLQDLINLNSLEKCSYKASPEGLYLKKVIY